MRTAVATVTIFGLSLTLQAASPPSIDGSLEDPFWSIDARTWAVHDPEHPTSAARFLLGYDERFLYLAAEVTDADVVGTHQSPGSATWLDDSVEFYIDFGDGAAVERTPETWQYTFSAAGGANRTRGIGAGSGEKHPAHDGPAGWSSEVQWAVRLRPGTSLNAAQSDTGYIVEARVPLKELGRDGPLRPDGSVGVNFVNIRRAGENRSEGRPLSVVPGLKPEEFHNPSRWQRIRLDWQAPFAIRGLALDLPARPENADEAFRWGQGTASPAEWLNQEGWRSRFALMRKHGLNALLLTHPAARRLTVTDSINDPLDGGRLRQILSEARGHGIRVYLAPGGDWPGPTTQIASTQPASSPPPPAQLVVGLLRAYPELAGLAIRPPAGLPGKAEFLIGLAQAMQAGAAQPGDRAAPTRGPQELLLWIHDEPAETLARVLDIYPHVRLLHDFQEGSWTSPQVDPRAVRLGAEVAAAGARTPRSPVSVVAVGGPGCASKYLFWGDPAWMRDVSLDLRRHGMQGMFFRPDSADPWLAIESWGVYAFQSGDVFNRKRWQKRLEEVYGVGAYAGQLLETVRHASAIMPRFCSLIDGCSPRYMPQLGLPLVCSVGLPTAMAARTAQSPAPADGPSTRPSAVPLVPPGPTPVASITEDVNRQAPPGAIGPELIGQAIGADADACRSRLTGLRHVKPALPRQAEELGRLLDRIEFNAALGEHYGHWIRAGLAWERLRAQRAADGTCIRELQKAREAWDAVIRMATRLHPDPVPFWEMQLVSPPPWTREQVLRSYRRVHGHWRDRASAFDRELTWLRHQGRADEPDSLSLPGWDILHAWSPEQLQGVSHLRFNQMDERRYRLSAGGERISQEGISIQGPSLVLNTRGLGGGWHRVFETVPTAMPIPLGRPLEVVFMYRVLQTSTEDPEPFLAGIRTTPEGPILGDQPRWGAPAGHQGMRVIKAPPLQEGTPIVTLDVLGEAAIVIDEVRLEAVKAAP